MRLSDGQFYPAGRANKIPLMRIAVVLLSMDFSDIAARDAKFVTSRDVAQWDKGGASLAGRVAGGLSLVLWIGVVYFARKTGFTLVQGGAHLDRELQNRYL